MSFSLALPTNRKFFERTLVQVSFADTGAWEETTPRKQKTIAKVKTRRFVISRGVYGKLQVNWARAANCLANHAEETARFSCRLYKPALGDVNRFAVGQTFLSVCMGRCSWEGAEEIFHLSFLNFHFSSEVAKKIKESVTKWRMKDMKWETEKVLSFFAGREAI